MNKKITGSTSKPRISIHRSLKHIYAQIVDDEKSCTIISASTLSKEIKDKIKGKTNIEKAKIVGELLAESANAKGIKQVVFDREGYRYHGRVKALADSARAKGLVF